MLSGAAQLPSFFRLSLTFGSPCKQDDGSDCDDECSDSKRAEIVKTSEAATFTHRIEILPYSYNNGFAWFCDANAIDCKKAYQGWPMFSRDKADLFLKIKYDTTELLNLGDSVCRKKVLALIRSNMETDTMLKNKEELQWAESQLDITAKGLKECNLRDDGTLYEVNEDAYNCESFNVFDLAIEMNVECDYTKALRRSEFLAALKKADNDCFLRSFKNEEAIRLAVLLRSLGKKGWRIRSDTVVSLTSISDSVVRLEREPQEYLIDVRGCEFDEFRQAVSERWPEAKWGQVSVSERPSKVARLQDS